MPIRLGAITFLNYLPKTDFYYALVFRFVCLKMLISKSKKYPQLQYCASKLRNLTEFENLSIYINSIFCDSLTNFVFGDHCL